MKKFIRRIEDFTCSHCGADVVGSGYTNHCPKCLWSRCVDINPGDRASMCGGMMRPINIETAGSKTIIIHKCEQCGKIARCRTDDADDIDTIIKISGNAGFIFGGGAKSA